jgi:hypothetical protein
LYPNWQSLGRFFAKEIHEWGKNGSTTNRVRGGVDFEETLVAVETSGGFPVGHHCRLKWLDHW